jgi:hypothetical protein
MKPNFASSSSISGVSTFDKGETKPLFAGTASFFGVFSFDQGEVVDVMGGGIWGFLGLCARLSSYNRWPISLLDMLRFEIVCVYGQVVNLIRPVW